jgi:hypothetical protein
MLTQWRGLARSRHFRHNRRLHSPRRPRCAYAPTQLNPTHCLCVVVPTMQSIDPSPDSSRLSFSKPERDTYPAAQRRPTKTQSSLATRRQRDRACDFCRRRKAKCDGPQIGSQICKNCQQSNKKCTYVSVLVMTFQSCIEVLMLKHDASESSKPRAPSKASVVIQCITQHSADLPFQICYCSRGSFGEDGGPLD